MKNRVLVGIAAIIVVSQSAYADPVILTSSCSLEPAETCVTSIKNLQVLGKTYDVAFVPGSFHSNFDNDPADPSFPNTFTFWGNQADAAVAANAISYVLTVDGNDWFFDPGQPSDFAQRVLAETNIVYGTEYVPLSDRLDPSVQIAFACCGSGTLSGSRLGTNNYNYALFTLSVPTLDCVGFEPPMNAGAVKVKKNRVLPFKAQLLDEDNQSIDDIGIAAPPVIQVIFQDGILPAENVSSEALPAGAGTDGNQFEFLDGKWQFNLKTRNYNAAGTYTVTIESGDTDEYLFDPTCEGTFVIN